MPPFHWPFHALFITCNFLHFTISNKCVLIMATLKNSNNDNTESRHNKFILLYGKKINQLELNISILY